MYPHRHERDDIIKYLADKYPACFFEEPNFRRPLKRDILDDLEKERVLDRAKLVHALDWYCSHFTYRRSIIAGAEKIGLDGKKAGVVSEAEQREARAWIAARKKEMAELARIDPPPPRPAAARETNGHEHTMTKITTTGVANGTATVPSLHPALAEVQTAITIVSSILTEERYEPLRPVLATAALREIVGKAEKLISSLQHAEGVS
jgi:sRNA-binding protein